jgi:plastocyanin
MKIGVIIGIVAVIIVLAGGFYFFNNFSFDREKIPSENENALTFSTPEKTPHFENSFPAHKDMLALPPKEIVINFNFDLHEISEISVTNNGEEYGSGETRVEQELTLRRSIDESAPDGLYTVKYKACWPDKSCHNGMFQFIIQRNLRDSFVDLRNQQEVTISMSDILFKPQNIIVSKGTTITWINDESAVHYVNTDPHAGHNYFPEQNSKAMKKGDTYALAFTEAGMYPYHCSAHASRMKGVVLVE